MDPLLNDHQSHPRSGQTVLVHGGGVRKASLTFNISLDTWLDLSTGINPRGWPVHDIPTMAWNRLPEAEDGLELAAKEYYGCPNLLPAAGSQAIIQTLPRLAPPLGRVGILSPTYAEHPHAWRMAGFEVRELQHVSDQILDEFSVLVVVNPNNPTADKVPRTTLLSWWRRLQRHQGWLVVDEAFMDADAGESISSDTGQDGLLVLRSIGKFFGLAGARVGFLLGPENLLQAAREQLGPWNVAGPSRWVATAALSDHSWIRNTRVLLQEQSLRLSRLLADNGLAVTAKTALFHWMVLDNHQAWWEALARQGILVRRFDHPHGLRFGLPGNETDWQRLARALSHVATTLSP
ncbi:MAG: threonine-phosphate decarboxylase [Magnetococcales bacterium]|nr:threonine-phosphate decarboxylase [Magnetococcales bacterium]